MEEERSFNSLVDLYSAVSMHELHCGVKFVHINNTKYFGTDSKIFIPIL